MMWRMSRIGTTKLIEYLFSDASITLCYAGSTFQTLLVFGVGDPTFANRHQSSACKPDSRELSFNNRQISKIFS
jgi:hypothetical protein